KTGDKLISDGVGHTYCNNWDCGGCLLGCTGGQRTLCGNYIDLVFDPFPCPSTKVIPLATPQFSLHGNIFALCVTKLTQRRYERVERSKTCIGNVGMARCQQADSRYLGRLLRTRGARPTNCCKAGNYLDEIASPHAPPKDLGQTIVQGRIS